MPILPKLIYRFNATSSKISARCFVDIDKLILKFIWKGTNPRIDKIMLKKKNTVVRLNPSTIKTYYIAK